MPRPVTRILSAGAAAAATVTAVSLFLSPPGEVDPLGALGRANASGPAASTVAPSAFGVDGVDLTGLGYRGPALDAVTVATLSDPFPELPTERAADIRDRIALAAPHLQSLHQAKNLLAKALPGLDHDVHAAKVAVVEAEDAWARAKDELAAVRARVAPPAPLPDEGGPDRAVPDGGGADAVERDVPGAGVTDGDAGVLASTLAGGDHGAPAAGRSDPVADPEAAPGGPDPVGKAAAVIELARNEALVAHTNQARLAAWADLEARREHRRALQAAAAAAEHEVWRMDAHVRWLEYEQWLAQGAMPSAGNWLVQEERAHGDLPIVEVRGFQVHRALADAVRQLVDSAAAAGIDLKGTAYRPMSRQIELRRQNCGPTDFDIFQKSPSLCSPPTAKPGRSLHELGLALDLQNGPNSIVSRSDPAFRWLAQHAPSYGLYNLPAEPWHWSITAQ